MGVVLRTTGISKAFGGVQAIEGISIGFAPGQVHGLVGANGAGKSTFIRILAGVHQPDAGEIYIDERAVQIHNPLHAQGLGLSFIHQELNLVPGFTVLQSLSLGLQKEKRFGIIDWRLLRDRIQPIAESLGFPFSLSEYIDNLSVADRWLVSIGHALVHKAQLIAMDEPTASLSLAEAERVFEIVRNLAARGTSIIYVSHRLNEIEQLCDRVTIFRDGKQVRTIEKQELTRQALIEGIIGREMPSPEGRAVRRESRQGAPKLEVRDLVRRPAVNGVSFSVGSGEIVGLAGLVGSGRTETVRLIFGADRPESGSILLEGMPVRFESPAEAWRHGVGLVPEERRSQGLLLGESVRFNLDLPSLRRLRHFPWIPLISPKKGSQRIREVAETVKLKPANTDVVVGRLSGGNQQKVVVGKWLIQRPSVLILDEPTRGVDVGARAEIHRTIQQLADNGVSVIMVASELEELVGCDRIIVMKEGHVVGELTGDDITVAKMLSLIYGVDPHTAS